MEFDKDLSARQEARTLCLQAEAAAKIHCRNPIVCGGADCCGAVVQALVPAAGCVLFPVAVWDGAGMDGCAFGWDRELCFAHKSRQLGEYIGYTSPSPAY